MNQDSIISNRKLRKNLYVVFAVLGVVFGAVQTAFVSASAEAPTWLDVAFQVYLYVGGAFGLLAAKNTVTPTADKSIFGTDIPDDPEAKHAE